MQDEIKKEEISTENTEAEEKASAEEVKEGRPEKKKCKKSEARIAELEEALAKKESELAEQNDKYLRLYAEYENFRRRSAKEREAIYSDVKSDTLKNILPILDNMERATAFTEADKILEGMNLILKSFNENFAKMDVKEIEALGKAFDP